MATKVLCKQEALAALIKKIIGSDLHYSVYGVFINDEKRFRSELLNMINDLPDWIWPRVVRTDQTEIEFEKCRILIFTNANAVQGISLNGAFIESNFSDEWVATLLPSLVSTRGFYQIFDF